MHHTHSLCTVYNFFHTIRTKLSCYVTDLQSLQYFLFVLYGKSFLTPWYRLSLEFCILMDHEYALSEIT